MPTTSSPAHDTISKLKILTLRTVIREIGYKNWAHATRDEMTSVLVNAVETGEINVNEERTKKRKRKNKRRRKNPFTRNQEQIKSRVAQPEKTTCRLEKRVEKLQRKKRPKPYPREAKRLLAHQHQCQRAANVKIRRKRVHLRWRGDQAGGRSD
ncbi:hypothetical protein MPER_05522 [Moniliophthora perniciosa FA553]|nr:hypothetical protein MPER_05522 [Moniliophthora perniciosa FA553]